jgi:hypothetical protein
MTHYADYDAGPKGGRKRTLCGTYIREREHDNTPSCPQCRQVLQDREDEDTPSLMRQLR